MMHIVKRIKKRLKAWRNYVDVAEVQAKLSEKALKRLYQLAEYLYIHKENGESEVQAYGRLKGVI